MLEKRRGRRFCSRCDQVVATQEPWRGWRPAWLVWRVLLVFVLALMPFLAAAFCVMLPSVMVFLLAGGILRTYAKTPAECLKCSLHIDNKEPPLPVEAAPVEPTPVD